MDRTSPPPKVNPHHFESPAGFPIKPIIQYHFLVFILALTAVLGRVISVEAPSLVFWRVSIAGFAMALWLAATNRSLLVMPRRRLLAVTSLGMIQGAHWVCFFWSVSLANVSVALAAFATISLFTAFTEPLMERRAIRLGELLCGGIVIAGILLIAGNLGAHHRLGLAVGLAGAFLHSIFPVLNRRLVARGTSPRSMVLYQMAGACLISTSALLFIAPHHFQFPARNDWIPLLTLALLCTTIAHAWNLHLLRRLTAYTANLTMNFEPVWGIILGAIVFFEYEQLHSAFYLGTALIIIANFLDPWLKKRRMPPPQSGSPGEIRG